MLPRIEPVTAPGRRGGRRLARRPRHRARTVRTASRRVARRARDRRPAALSGGLPASRIHWPTVARRGEMLERRLVAELDSAPLVILDSSAPASQEALDSAVRAAASLCVWLGHDGGCAILLPGDRRPIEIGHDLGAWPAVHVRLALVEEGARPRRGGARSARGCRDLGHGRGPARHAQGARAAARRLALRGQPVAAAGRARVLRGRRAARAAWSSVAAEPRSGGVRARSGRMSALATPRRSTPSAAPARAAPPHSGPPSATPTAARLAAFAALAASGSCTGRLSWWTRRTAACCSWCSWPPRARPRSRCSGASASGCRARRCGRSRLRSPSWRSR